MILEQVKTLVAKEFNVSVETLTPSTRLVDDIGIDSLDAVELMMRVEDVFGIKIADDEAQKIKTVGDLVAVVTAKKA